MRYLSPSLNPGDSVQVQSHYPGDEWLVAYDTDGFPLGGTYLIIVYVPPLKPTL